MGKVLHACWGLMVSMGCVGVMLHAFVMHGVMRVCCVCGDAGTHSCRSFACCGCAGARGFSRAVRQASRAAQSAIRGGHGAAQRRVLTIAGVIL
jgi:hypothetical protein